MLLTKIGNETFKTTFEGEVYAIHVDPTTRVIVRKVLETTFTNNDNFIQKMTQLCRNFRLLEEEVMGRGYNITPPTTKVKIEFKVQKASKRETSFEVWMSKVDNLLEKKYGISSEDLPDADFTSFYEKGMSPAQMVKKLISSL